MNYTTFVESRRNVVVDQIAKPYFLLNVSRSDGMVVQKLEKIIPYIWNPMLFEMGMDYPRLVQKNSSGITSILQELDDQFDLVMISDRMDESLVLFKGVPCTKT